MSAARDRSRHRPRPHLFLPLLALVVLAGCSASGKGDADAALAASYSFWPPPPNEPRVQFLVSYRLSSDVEPPRGAIDRIIFGEEARVLPIAKPYGVDMWNGRIYVCDITNPGVVILDLVKQETRVMGTRGVEYMVQPTDIAIAPDGMKYVVDRRLGRIFVFNAADQHVVTFGEREISPVSVAVHGNELYVPDFDSQTILVLNRFDGTTLRSIGGPGGNDGQFVRPLGVDLDETGAIFVTDVIGGRFQKFDPDGSFVFSQGQISDTPGSFVRPKHLAVDPEGIIYIVDAAFQNVQMFSPDGEVLMFFGGPGDHPGSMSLPAGICVVDGLMDLFERYVHPAFEARRIILVTNQFGINKVSVYALGQLKEGHTVEEIMPRAADVLPPEPPDLPPSAPSGDETQGSDAPAPETATPGPM